MYVKIGAKRFVILPKLTTAIESTMSIFGAVSHCLALWASNVLRLTHQVFQDQGPAAAHFTNGPPRAAGSCVAIALFHKPVPSGCLGSRCGPPTCGPMPCGPGPPCGPVVCSPTRCGPGSPSGPLQNGDPVTAHPIDAHKVVIATV